MAVRGMGSFSDSGVILQAASWNEVKAPIWDCHCHAEQYVRAFFKGEATMQWQSTDSSLKIH